MLSHLSLRERLSAAHGWSREAGAQRSTARRLADWQLKLEALGAPETLIAESDRLAKDAADLASRCSRLAYGLLGRGDAVAPEPDWPAELAHGVDPAALALAILRAGGIEETIRAAQMMEAARRAEPDVGAMVEAMAGTGQKVAAFSWRALIWLLDEVLDGGSRAFVVEALDAVCREAERRHQQSSLGMALATPGRPGQLGSADRSRVALAALKDEVRPRLAAVFR